MKNSRSEERVLKYAASTRVLHWAHALAFVALAITGAFLYFAPVSFLARDSWSRMIHRGAAIVFVAAPLVYVLAHWRRSWESVREALTWTSEDLGWLAAAPSYYFIGDESSMPPQDHINTGQKMWYLILLISGAAFIVTGIIMWAFKETLPSAVFQWSVFVHDVYFVVVLSMFFVHIYLSALHPLMRQHGGAFSSMVSGTISADYARTHHEKWYRRALARNPAGLPERGAAAAAQTLPKEG